jgi:hypothetical protein
VSTHHRPRPAPVTVSFSAFGQDGGPPLRSKVTAALAVVACAACYALPLLKPLPFGHR